MSIPEIQPEQFHKTVVDNLFDGVYYVDRKRHITYWNHGAERISGYAADEVVGRRCFDNILRHVDGEGNELCHGKCPLVAAMATRRRQEKQVYFHHRDGHRVPIHIRAAPIFDPDGTVVGAVEIFNEDSVLLSAQEEIDNLRRLSSLDSLTRIRNRRALELSLRSRVRDSTEDGWPLGVLFLDIDRFKRVNDEHGHETGDAVLVAVAATISGILRPSDVVGRWGGEEFVALTTADDAETLWTIAERLRMLVAASALDRPEGELRVTVSIGAAIAAPEDSAESLLARADRAMYRSKALGRNRVTIAEEDLHRTPARARARLAVG